MHMKLIRILALVLAVLLCAACAYAEETAEAKPVVTVNGTPVYQVEIDAVANEYLSMYAYYGYDTTDESLIAAVNEYALELCIKTVVVDQDLAACGAYEVTDEAVFAEAGQLAYESMVSEYTDYFVTNYGLDSVVAEAYAESVLTEAGYTVSYFTEYYRQLTAMENYKAWLMRDEPEITDTEVEAEYEARVSASRETYGDDISAFETAMTNDQEVWYRPAGYRSVLQIMLKAEGETDEEKLASVQDKLDAIDRRLAAGEDFRTLIAEYGEDPAFEDPAFYETGYTVHRDSVMWADGFVATAFSAEMQKPGDHSKAAIGDGTVYILYYLKDCEAGPVALTDDVRAALKDDMYATRASEKVQERTNELLATAEIIYTEN